MREDLKKIVEEIKEKRKFNPFMDKGLLELIENQLSSSEEVKYLVFANAGIITKSESLKVKPFDFKNKTPGILTITTKRILFCSKILFNKKIEEVALENINNIESKTTLMSGVLRIQSITNNLEIDLQSKEIENVTKLIHELKDNLKNEKSSNNDPMSKIEKLKELKDKGVITEEEFQKKKEQLLNEI